MDEKLDWWLKLSCLLVKICCPYPYVALNPFHKLGSYKVLFWGEGRGDGELRHVKTFIKVFVAQKSILQIMVNSWIIIIHNCYLFGSS